MKLHQLLTESTSFPLDQLKKLMLKDARISIMFKRGFDADSIANVDDFIRAANKYVFDNVEALDLLKKSPSIVNPKQLSTIRNELRAGTQNMWVARAAATIIKELLGLVSRLENKKLTADALDELRDVIADGGGKMWRMRSTTKEQLEQLKAVPDKPVRVYRSVSFTLYDLESSAFSRTPLGIAFQKKIRNGTSIIDLDEEHHTLWTTDRKLAELWAKDPDTANWASLGQEPGKLSTSSKELGFVMSLTVKPENVLVDLHALIEMGVKVGNQRALTATGMILKPGRYSAAIVEKFQNGKKVNVVEKDQDEVSTTLEATQEVIKLLQRITKLPKELPEDQSLFWNYDAFKKIELVKPLADPGMEPQLKKLLNTLLSFYKTRIASLDLSALSMSVSAKDADMVSKLLKLEKLFSESFSYFEPGKRHATTIYFNQLDKGEDLYKVHVLSSISSVAQLLKGNKRVTSRFGTIEAGAELARVIDPSVKIDTYGRSAFHLMGWARQKKILENIIDGLLKTVGESTSEPMEEKMKKFTEINETVAKNLRAARLIVRIKQALDEQTP